MSRLFNGTTDLMTFANPASGPGPWNFTFGTLLVLARFVTSPTWASFIEGEDSGGIAKFGLGRRNTGGLYFSDGATIHESLDTGTGTTFSISTADNWCLYVMAKATGTVGATFSKFPVGGARTTIAITGTSVNTTTTAGGRIKLGGDDDFANIRLGIAAVFPGVVLTTGQIDTIAAAKTTASILALAPADGWVVDDSDTFTNNLVANNTNRSAISGTSNDADNPAGWTFGAGGGGGAAATPGPVIATNASVMFPRVWW